MNLEEELTGLNDAQSEVVSNLNDNLLVMAPAGTGKTKVISLRVAGFINQGIEAKEILCLTFTNKACHELAERMGWPKRFSLKRFIVFVFNSLKKKRKTSVRFRVIFR